VLEYLDEVVYILFVKQYFSYLETSICYVDDLIDDIKKNLPTKLHKPASQYFDKYGKSMEYAVFKKSKRTSWYIFFNTYEDEQTGEDIFLVRYIGNNHTIAQYL